MTTVRFFRRSSEVQRTRLCDRDDSVMQPRHRAVGSRTRVQPAAIPSPVLAMCQGPHPMEIDAEYPSPAPKTPVMTYSRHRSAWQMPRQCFHQQCPPLGEMDGWSGLLLLAPPANPSSRRLSEALVFPKCGLAPLSSMFS